MKWLKKGVLISIICLLSFFITDKILNMILYDYMFVVDMRDNNEYKITNSYDNGVSFDLEKNEDYYSVEIPSSIVGYELDLSIKLDENEKRIIDVICNGKTVEKNKIIKLSDYSDYDESYRDLPLFIIDRNSNIKIPILIIVSSLLALLVSYIIFSANKSLDNFIYSNTFIKTLKKYDWIILVAIFVVVFKITVGCDAKVIANVGNLFYKGIDIYQLQVNTRFITGRVYAEFPYNPLMLCVWGGILSIFRPLTQRIPIIGNYPFFEVGIIKLFNLFFIFLTICSIISFLLDKKIIDKKRAKWIYYLGLFNPVTFYVALLFVQIDALTLYLVVTGTLLLDKLNSNNYLGILLLSIGLLLKMQMLFLIPGVIITILYLIFFCSKDSNGKKIVRLLKCVFIFSVVLLFSFAIPYILKTPFHFLETNLEQSERVWFTTIPFSANIFLFVALGALAMATILFVLNINSKIKKENLIIATIINYAVIIFLFSFATIPTPSIYIVTLGAMIMMIALEPDKLKNILFSLMSLLIIFCPMVSDYGDISKVIKNPNESGFITNYVRNMESKDSERVMSIAFTISAVSMLTYAIYFQSKSINLIKGECNNV